MSWPNSCGYVIRILPVHGVLYTGSPEICFRAFNDVLAHVAGVMKVKYVLYVVINAMVD